MTPIVTSAGEFVGNSLVLYGCHAHAGSLDRGMWPFRWLSIQLRDQLRGEVEQDDATEN